MAPFNQLSVLAFASAALAVPHVGHFKRHAHPAAPPAYGDSSAPPEYGATSSAAGAQSSAPAYNPYPTSSSAGAVGTSSAGSYGSSAGSYGSSAGSYGSSAGSYGSSAGAASSSGIASPSGSGSVISAVPSSVSSAPGPSSTPACWSACFAKNSVQSESSLCGNTAVSDCICDTCSKDDDKTYKQWLATYCSASSSAGAISSSAAGGYGSSSAHGVSYSYPASGYGTGYSGYGTGYSFKPTGYSGSASYSTCTETSTLIYRSTTEYSTYYVTHTVYPNAPASSAGAGSISGGAGGYPSSPAQSSPAQSGPGGYPASPSGAPAGPAGSGSPASGAAGSACVPDVTVTTTEKSTVYVTAGPSSAGGYPAPSGSEGAAPSQSYPASWEPAPSASSGPASSSAPGGYSSAPAPSSAPASPAPSSGSPAPSSAPASYASPSSAVSAPAPSGSAPSGGYGGASGYSGKRGLAYNDAGLTNMFAQSSYVGWAYNWEPDNKGLDDSIPYIPCLHSDGSMWTDIWDAAAQGAVNNGGKWLFGMNEPDMVSQANMSPTDAATFWKQWMEPYAGKIGLVAPAVTSGVGANIGVDWLKQFLEACSDCTIDAVGQHWYNSNGNDVQNFKDTVNAAAAFGKPVWVSEFGAIGSDQEKSTFLEAVMPWMDNNDSVLGYSYYMVSDGLLCNGDAPSSYGQTYADYSG